MASGAKSFVVNRVSDWQNKSVIKNLNFKDDKMVYGCTNGESGIYISSAFDSMQKETVWHRLRLKVNMPPGAIYKLRLYASDTPAVKIPSANESGHVVVNLNDYLHDDKIDIVRKIDTLEYVGCKVYQTYTDVLLNDLTGRYLWVSIEALSGESGEISFESMKIEFPKVSFTEYLPEVYRQNQASDSFLERFVGIFQSIYVDVEDEIDYTPINFDCERAPVDFLRWIADWMSIKDITVWGEDKLRQVIKNAIKIYKMKGTKRAVAKIVQEYTGVEPIIVEQFDVKENMYYDKQKKVVENLFGDNGYVFTVMLPQAAVKDSETYASVLKIISSVKPIDAICNLVVLNDRINLDHHSYMGMNSFITKNEELVLDTNLFDVNNLVVVNQ